MYNLNNEYKDFIKDNIVDSSKNYYSMIFPGIPDSGWKIHVSCTLKNYNNILDIVSRYCVKNRISFKVIKDINKYFANGHKNGDRSSYGKFITIYPKNEDDFIRHIENLYFNLYDYEGPFILSDLRYKDCKCLYYRYGSNIINRTYDSKGNICRLIEYNGISYIDKPRPYFYLPDFIKNPIEQNENISKSSNLLFKYKIDEVLKFSPIGGVYKAIQKYTNLKCVVKEFYPHTAIVNEKIDSLFLYTKEVSNLKKLKEFKFIPNIIEHFKDWQNYYIIEEYISGDSLDNYVSKNNSIILESDYKKSIKYIYDAVNILIKVTENIISLYEKGYIFTDLAPDNIIINKNNVYFVDLESVFMLNDNKDALNYTINFFNCTNSNEDNIKLVITNLLLYCFNKKSKVYDKFTPRQILSPIIRRCYQVDNILDLINEINDSETSIFRIKLLFEDYSKKIFSAVSSGEYNEPNLEPTKKEIFQVKSTMISSVGYEYDILENKNSLAYGTLGQFLALNYIFDYKHSKDTFLNYIKDYRSNSFFYGYSGLLYVLDLNEIGSNDIVEKILGNIDYTDKSLSTGISGIGISLLYNYLAKKNANTLKVLREISLTLKENEELDNSLETGRLGVSLFYIYYYYIFKDTEALSLAEKIINQVILDYKDNGYKKIISNQLKDNHYEYYLSNGICGLLSVLVEFTIKTKQTKYTDNIIEFTKLCFGIYSLSSSYFHGNAGFLYTFFRMQKNINISKKLEKNILNQINNFYLDITNTIINDEVYDISLQGNRKNFLGGKEGVYTILDMVNRNDDSKNIFPFII